MKIKSFFIFFYFITGTLFGDLNFNAKKVSYSDKKIYLNEDVKIENEIGTLCCKNATIFSESSLKNIQKLELTDDINIELKNKFRITSPWAEINLKKRNAFLDSKNINEPIFLFFNKKNFNQYHIPSIKTLKLYIDFDEEYNVKKIKADEKVIVEDSDYEISGIQGEFDSNGNISVVSPKIVFLNNNVLKNAVINCSKLILNINERKIFLFDVKGHLYDQNNHIISLKADQIDYDEIEEKITLLNNIEINHISFNIINSSEVTLKLNNALLETIHFLGDTTIKYFSSNKKLEYFLFSDGDIFLDTKKMIFYGKKNFNQIHFENHFGKIYGDSFKVFYQNSDNKYKPQKMIVEENIKFFNEWDKNHKTSLQKCALADKIELCCESKVFELISHGVNPVLFYDPINNIKISADGIKYDNGKFKGLGKVRFHFLAKEIEEIESNFKF